MLAGNFLEGHHTEIPAGEGKENLDPVLAMRCTLLLMAGQADPLPQLSRPATIRGLLAVHSAG